LGYMIEHALPTAVPLVKFDIVSAPNSSRDWFAMLT